MKQIFNLKSYLTFLSRNKVYTAINVFGLSVSLMFVILLVVFVRQEYTVDTQHSRLDRIYLFAVEGGLKGKESPTVMGETSQGFGPELMKRMPSIEGFCPITYYPESKLRLAGQSPIACNILYTDTAFYSIFDFDLILGDKRTALADPGNIVLSESFARRLFGDSIPMGRRLTLQGDSTFLVVTGVFRSLGNTSVTITPDVIRPNHRLIEADPSYTNYNNSLGGASLYLLARPGVDLRAQQPQFERVLKDFCPEFFDSDVWNMRPVVVPLRELYLSQVETNMGRRGDAKMVRIFSLVAIIILLFAVMNYINLTVAQSGYRAREMASRRLFGAQRSEIVLKLITESVALCLLSLAVGLVLAVIFAPYVGRLLNADAIPVVSFVCQSPVGLSLLGVAVLIGLVAGIIPAVIQSRAKPIDVVRGTFRKTTRMVFSRIFIVAQNVITIALVASALTIYFQIRHMVSAPLGYDHRGVMIVYNPRGNDLTTTLTFRDRLLQESCVRDVSICQKSPFNAGSDGYHLDGQTNWLTRFRCDEHWLPLFGIKAAEEFGQSTDGSPYVNRRLMEQFGIAPDRRSWYPHGDNDQRTARQQFRGLLPDFHVGHINTQEFTDRPVLVEVYHDLSKVSWWSMVLIRVDGDEEEALRRVGEVYKSVYGEQWIPFENMPYLDQWIEHTYESQQRLLNVVALFAVIAMLISLMGLIAMSTYFIQQRRKEIAIRKVYGSTSRQIWSSLVRTFLLYVGIAFVIAAPIVWHYMGDWLSEFNYRIQLWPWILVAGFTCFIISFAAVFIQSFLASNENPINHIKDNG